MRIDEDRLFSMDELESAAQGLRTEKAPDPDDISVECVKGLIKACSDTVLKVSSAFLGNGNNHVYFLFVRACNVRVSL